MRWWSWSCVWSCKGRDALAWRRLVGSVGRRPRPFRGWWWVWRAARSTAMRRREPKPASVRCCAGVGCRMVVNRLEKCDVWGWEESALLCAAARTARAAMSPVNSQECWDCAAFEGSCRGRKMRWECSAWSRSRWCLVGRELPCRRAEWFEIRVARGVRGDRLKR